MKNELALDLYLCWFWKEGCILGGVNARHHHVEMASADYRDEFGENG